MLKKRKIEVVYDSNDPSVLLKEITSYKELKETFKNEETIYVYSGNRQEGTVYSFNPYDEENPSQYDFKDFTVDWLSDRINEDPEIRKAYEDEYDSDISEMAGDYYDEHWDYLVKNGDGPMMLETDDAGPYGGRHGIIFLSFNDDYSFFKEVEDLSDYEEEEEED